uniref:Uncharacterized protein n=1 Tax=viral metagenome TaxID=1070528 RepID=A0A6H1ZNY2_9ZZZZ
MIDEKVTEDLDLAVDKVREVKALLDRLYYNSDFGTFYTRPFISMLIQACTYLADNIEVLADKYREQASR